MTGLTTEAVRRRVDAVVPVGATCVASARAVAVTAIATIEIATRVVGFCDKKHFVDNDTAINI